MLGSRTEGFHWCNVSKDSLVTANTYLTQISVSRR